MIPDLQPAAPAYGSTLTVGVSNYGAVPTFPAPAPAGPYTMALPLSTNINGTWDLYVIDTAANSRGVIAGGWSLHYVTDIRVPATQTLVPVPGIGTGPGVAATYPITFDLSGVPVGVPVEAMWAEITFHHSHPDDLRIALQSPSGTTVNLMSNAGGATNVPAGTKIRFAHGYSTIPDDGPIDTGSYGPSLYGSSAQPPPAPAGPYLTDLGSFDGEPVRGIWKLWVFDDASVDTGQIESAALVITTESLNYSLSPALPLTTNQPFVHIRGVLNGGSALNGQYAGSWRVTNGGQFYEAGPFVFTPGTNEFSADVPLKKGSNSINWSLANTAGHSSSSGEAITVDEFTYSLAEGATGPFFDTQIVLANPTSNDAPVTFDFLPEGGAPVTISTVDTANAPYFLQVDNVIPAAAVSTIVHSTNAVPLAVERTMSWDSTGYGGHGGMAVAPSTRWLFAEGSQGFFSTFVLLANDNAAAVDVSVKFLLEGGGVVTVPVNVPAKSRHTLFAGDVPQLVNNSFGIDITAAQPIIAERSMYLPGPRLFEGGHETAGVNETSTHWFLAEGATGEFFDCFVLISNPNATDAHVTVTYLLPSGATIDKTIVVPANSRHTINVETEDPQLANADVSTTVVSDIGVVVERAMYWPNISLGWREAHDSFGVTETALHWGLADGRIGSGRGTQTFILLANPNPYPAEVLIRFLRPTYVVTRTYTLNPSSRLTVYPNIEVPELGGGIFSADIQVLNYQPIAVEKALYWNSGAETFAGGTNVTATRLPPP